MNLWLEIIKLFRKRGLLKQNKIIPTYSKNSGVKMIGALYYITGVVYCEEHERYDTNVFLGFMKIY